MKHPKELAIQLFKRMYLRIFRDKIYFKLSPEKMERRKAMYHEKFVDDAKSLATIAADTLIHNKEEKLQVEDAIKHVNVSVALQ
ncbi:MAG: hypothetical protein M3004_03680 [Bacteroidota bacterium]|nr:hypothetical protein [Bacteroidota bacterium]